MYFRELLKNIFFIFLFFLKHNDTAKIMSEESWKKLVFIYAVVFSITMFVTGVF